MMINKIFSGILCILLTAISSCSINKSLHKSEQQIEGNWQLSTVVSEDVKKETLVTLFNETDFRCFIGSNWNFSKGVASYTIPATADNRCTAQKQNMSWGLFTNAQKSMLIRFKNLGDNLQGTESGSAGYFFEIVSVNSGSMQLRSDLLINGRHGVFLFKFIKL